MNTPKFSDSYVTMFIGQTTPSISIPFIQLIKLGSPLTSGMFVQEIRGAQLYLVINTSPEMELSSTSIFYALNKNPSPMLGTVMAPVVAIITCLKFSGSCVTMFMEQKNHSISVPLMHLFRLG